MSLVYAVREDTGKRGLVEITCDGCSATVKPHPDIARSGWAKRGSDHGPGTDKLEWHYCPDCGPSRA